MPSKILTQTTNLFKLYKHICGKSEIPEIFHFWSFVSLISAVVEDRVWYQRFKHTKLFPNLFIILIGPSGLGKSVAISHAVNIARKSTSINIFEGRSTAAHLIDRLGKPYTDEWGQKCLANPKLWLVMDELRNDISPNVKMIEDFIFFMTKIYTSANSTMDTGTRGHGEIKLHNPLINWLSGTTNDDLREIMTAHLMRSGFTARTCFIWAENEFDKRILDIKYPEDYEEVYHHICTRLWMMQRAEGSFMITSTAKMELDLWYDTRDNPEEELLYSSWNRDLELLLKFAMILCLADGGPLVLQHKHIIHAQAMIGMVQSFNNRLIEAASETQATRPINDLAKYMKKRKVIDHTTASRYFRSVKGLNGKQFNEVVLELSKDGCLEIGVGPKGGKVYKWRG